MYSYHAAEVNVTFNLRVRVVYFVFLFKTLSLVFTFNYELEFLSLFQDISGNTEPVLFTRISSKRKHFKVIGEIQKQKNNYDNKDNDDNIDDGSGAVDYQLLKMIIMMIMIMTMTTVCFFLLEQLCSKSLSEQCHLSERIY